MAYDNYNAPLFGRMSLAYPFHENDYTHYFQIRNTGKHQLKDDKGRVIQGDIFYTMSYHLPTGDVNNQSLEAIMWCSQGQILNDNNNPLAILAVPRRYGSIYALTEKIGNLDLSWYRQDIEAWNALPESENLCFDYFLVFGHAWGYDKPKVLYANTAQVGRYIESVYGANWLYNIVPPKDRTETQQSPSIRKYETSPSGVPLYYLPNGFSSVFTDLPKSLDTFVTQTMYEGRVGYTDAPVYTNTTKDRITAAIIVGLASEYKETLESMRIKPLATRALKVGSTITTGIPVFTIDNIQYLIKYMAGEEVPTENDIDPPPSDWSTDWKIYVKGAQRPDIWVTMASEKVDTWLGDMNENKAGATKQNIAVEYRYREHEMDTPINPAEPPSFSETYTLKNLSSDVYNNTKATSYSENVLLNYPALTSAIGFNEFSDAAVEGLFPFYAELEFRLRYNKYRSAWCRYEVGVIGSPSVPDFTEMHNVGEQTDDEWQDDSTVELIYDQIPEGEDPYPDEPDPDLPDPDPTDPSPSESGLGLLTTTYKITKANAQALGRFFWGGDLFEKIKALNMSPIENVVGLVMMPIDIAGATSVITIGDVDTNINGDVISNVPLYELGSVELKGRYNSFLDYEPFTSAFIFLPFVGFVRLDPAYFTNRTLKVVYAYDIINGLCNAMLFADNIYVESHQGQCGIEIPLIATNRSQLQLSLMTSLIQTAASAATGGLSGKATKIAKTAISGGANVSNDIGDFIGGFHSSRQGNYSPTTAWNETRECFIVIESVNASRSSSFAHDYGLPCAATYNIGQLRGFTQCAETVDVSGISGATEEEKTEIYTLLTGGFFV